jgi:hypothetical protein
MRDRSLRAILATALLSVVVAAAPAGLAAEGGTATEVEPVQRDAIGSDDGPPEAQAVSQARREAALRSTLGFNSDPEYVQRLIDDPERHSAMPDEQTFGYHFTPEERQEFLDRMALQQSGVEIGTYGLEHASEDYAGARLDHESGELVVGFRSGLSEHRAQARARVSDSSRLRVVEVPFSQEQYRAMTELLLDATQELHRDGVRLASVGHDWERGMLEVGLDDHEFNAGSAHTAEQAGRYREALRAVLPEEFQGVGIDFVEPEMGIGQDRGAYNPPLRGGVHFRMDRPDHANGNCTSGFVTRRPNSSGGTQWGILTAGHCGYVGTRVRWGNSDSSTTVGFVSSSSWYDSTSGISSDSSYLHINSALRSRWIYKDLNRQAYAITKSIAPIEAKGYLVCMAGRTNPGAMSGNNCGTIYNASVNGALPYFCGGTPNRCRNVMDFVGVRGSEMGCASGDSGAPLHAGSEAWGIHYGSNPITGNCYYSRIRFALEWHGLTDVETN